MTIDTLPTPPSDLEGVRAAHVHPWLADDGRAELARELLAMVDGDQADTLQERARGALAAYVEQWGAYDPEAHPIANMGAFDSHDHRKAWLSLTLTLIASTEPDVLAFLFDGRGQ